MGKRQWISPPILTIGSYIVTPTHDPSEYVTSSSSVDVLITSSEMPATTRLADLVFVRLTERYSFT
jgi:hypothetical protein